ncbi:hypothetical protein GCM10011344_00920 [Dokdonia pacifica]|uniref:2OG-Fe(II) oxygenase superfamily protein n=1 Tax=Dokdonia pacifica TaxID=1627892 RepID=A0A239CY67_9FLAO|nr:hypothetical protein [Dokdonia pacifica]GGG04378.1 hypothetical protein GCM10011344_00920 [Dokdonia pacifica]SNS25155.1 hypothetical protein SAMN06265376_10948 [Dokdonia pacifica]
MNTENNISKDKNILLILSDTKDQTGNLQYLTENFCGIIVQSFSEIQTSLDHARLYVCGDINKYTNEGNHIHIIQELSYNYENFDTESYQLITLGQVPIIIHNAGVYYRHLFGDSDYFNAIKSEHDFQELTESNKQSTALRKGIYLAEVSKDKEESLHFHLLRCSSNLTGPTDNFRDTDHHIVGLLNNAVTHDFEQETKLNHVLAQIYLNKKKTDGKKKEVKAKIKAHSDKTKDMPKEGLIAFCTFYDTANFEHLQPSKTDPYDWCYKQTSGLTRLLFKLKNTVDDDSLEKEFSVTLYPNSAFLIPLSTNRLYTHEIRPSVLNIDKIPVRMGYVVRCSNLEAVYENDQTYIKEQGELIKLEEMTQETMDTLRESYYEENKTEKRVKYGNVHFSMNSGDYKKPIY